MQKITILVIKLSEIPTNLQTYEVLKNFKINSYGEFHIDESETDKLTKWLISTYTELISVNSFLIHFDKDI